MKKYVLFIWLFFLFFSYQINAQEDTLADRIIFQVPQYMISQGIRIDLDQKINAQNQWLVISPQFYWAKNTQMYAFDDMIGYGLDLQHKFLLSKNQSAEGVYLGYGLTYQNYYAKYHGEDWVTYHEDGVEYQTLKEKMIKQNIFKLGPNFVMGLQVELKDFLYIDAYAGMGFRIGIHAYPGRKKFDNNIFDPGYSGIMPLAGLRAGISLKS